MIVQCEACQTRFRLADEKIKPGGTKVRCSKCKEIFTVNPPEPEPVEETVDFGSFNMEKVSEDTGTGLDAAPEDSELDDSSPTGEEASFEDDGPDQAVDEPGEDLDFSSLEQEMASASGLDSELADEFSFADTSQPAAEDETVDYAASPTESLPGQETFDAGETDFSAAFAETAETDGPVEFDFGGAETPTESPAEPFSEEPAAEPSEFAFGEDEPAEPPGEFSFEEESDGGAFSFDETPAEQAPADSEEYSEPGEFSFDDEDPFQEETAAEWSETAAGDNSSFDFDEPRFDADDAPAAVDFGADEGGLQFGEINFANDNEQSAEPGFQAEDDFSKATLQRQEEPEPFAQQPQSAAPPSRSYDDEPLPVPAKQKPKKSPLSRILVLLVLLLVVLGGAAGFLFMQEGSLNLGTVVRYLPFLKDYIGEAAPASPGERIGINIIGSSYVNGPAGQMLVIQGTAVNNHPSVRSAITIKGVLLDASGKTLLQQTVFCGNRLDEAALKSMAFPAIEEAMNNQFGDSLSNMNVAPGAAIPFTIVFRNLPSGIANINVEVVDSKPGAK